MALEKAITLDNGVTVNYHRISKITLDCPYGILLTVNSYISENDRGKQRALETGSVEDGTVFPYMDGDFINVAYDNESPLLNGNILEAAYNYLKETDKYKDSIDV